MAAELNASCTLWEYILTMYGYCPRLSNLQEERSYHAIFLPAFHRDCFLSLYTSSPGNNALLAFGSLAHIWEWKRYVEIVSAIQEKQEFPILANDACTYLKHLQMEALRNKYGFPPATQGAEVYLHNAHLAALKEGYGPLARLNDLAVYLEYLPMGALREASGFPHLSTEESVYMRNVHLVEVPFGVWNSFEKQIQEIHPLDLETQEPEGSYRDGINARGIIADTSRIHRFDISGEPQTNGQRTFFQEFIRSGSACLEEKEQIHLKAILSSISPGS